MEKVKDLFLSFSDMEKYNLFLNILEMKQKEATPKQLLKVLRRHDQHITDINIKQVAELLGRSYGSIYNTYMGLVGDLGEVVENPDANLEELFSVPPEHYYAYLTLHSHPYQFIDAIVKGKVDSFQTFYNQLGSSKATVLRHLKNMRHFLRYRDIRMTYEPMGLVGKNELGIRIAITSLYWRAGSIYHQPFGKADLDKALTFVHETSKNFDLLRQNANIETLMALFVLVSYHRILQGHLIHFDDSQQVLRYAYPNLVKDYIQTHQVQLDLSEADTMQETSALFLVYNLLPIYSETNKASVDNFLQKIDYYNKDLSDFACAFLGNLPLEEHDALAKTPIDSDVLKANLIAILVGTLTFKNANTFLFNTDDQNLLTKQHVGNTALYLSLESALSHLVIDKQYAVFKPIANLLLPAFDSVLRPVLELYKPQSQVNVYIQVNPSYFDNSRLEQMIKNLAFVSILDPKDDLSKTDLVVCSDTVSLPAKLPKHVVTMRWHRNPNSDFYGRLYGVLREIQLNKENANLG